jgi:hypothetical protein
LTNQELSYLIALLFPIPSGFHIVPSTKDFPSTPRLVEALEHSFNEEDVELDLLDGPFPCCLGVHDEVIPNKVFKVETPYHDNDLILTPIISPQSG